MAARIAGQRRYPQSAAELVGIILLLRDAGFSLAEQKALMASRAAAPRDWHQLALRKLAELDHQIAKAQTARDAIEHALRCPHQNFLECPTFADVIAARLTANRSAKLTRTSHCTPCPTRHTSIHAHHVS
jgi:MerR family copper efflux transcriptional regulator